MKTTLGPQRIPFPSPTTLVVTGNMKKANIVTIAWVSMLTSKPPTLGISVGTRGFSGGLIKKNKNFTVNIATVNNMKQTDYCGITSGREINKFDKTGLTKMPSKNIESPIINECPINVECRLVEARMVGLTNHFIGEILEIHVDSDKMHGDAKPGSIDITAIEPLIYFSGVRKYCKLEKIVGDAYEIGKSLK